MHAIEGGNYEGKEYSCMFHMNDKYQYLSPDETLYFQFGIREIDAENYGDALLVFSVETEKLIYAEPIEWKEQESEEETLLEERRVIFDLLRRSPWLDKEYLPEIETEIQKYIYYGIPDATYSEMWDVRNDYIYNFIPLNDAIKRGQLKKMAQKWDKSKNKHYYRVPMMNGGSKIVYMCQQQVEHMYKDAERV